jgi:hypothetical protein
MLRGYFPSRGNIRFCYENLEPCCTWEKRDRGKKKESQGRGLPASGWMRKGVTQKVRSERKIADFSLLKIRSRVYFPFTNTKYIKAEIYRLFPSPPARTGKTPYSKASQNIIRKAFAFFME